MRKIFFFIFLAYLVVAAVMIGGLCKADLSHWAGEELGTGISGWSGEDITSLSEWVDETIAATGTGALTLVGGASISYANTAAPTITHGQTIASGDLIVAVVHFNGAITITDNNTGYEFTEVDEDYFNSEERAVYWRVAGASEPSSYAWTGSSNNRVAISLVVLRPPSGTSVQTPPFDVTPATVTTGSTTAISAPAQTGTTNGVTWVAVAYVDGAETFTAFPSGYTQDNTHIETNQPISMYFKLNQNSGTTGTADWTLNAAQATGAEIFILKPAS